MPLKPTTNNKIDAPKKLAGPKKVATPSSKPVPTYVYRKDAFKKVKIT